MNRRGKPEQIFSDCGTNFKGTTKELKIETRKMSEFATKEGIIWDFNPPASPHMGGVWERAVRTVKNVMYSMIKNTVLTEFQLITILTEIESVVNNRPLTHVSDSPDDFEALTPNHFLIGRYNTSGAVIQDIDGDESSRKKWKQVVAITKQFWKRWLLEYLPTLQSRSKWQTNQTNIKPGTLVILKDDNLPRGRWPLGRIVDVMPSEDGVVRVIRIKMAGGVYVRPVVKIFPLECSSQ